MENFKDLSILLSASIALIVFLAIFIDRVLLSNTGFSNIASFIVGVTIIAFATLIVDMYLTKLFPDILGASSLMIMIIFHVLYFWIINIIVIFSTYICLKIDTLLKKIIPNQQFKIFTHDYLSLNALFKNKNFLKYLLITSYFISVIMILFPIPMQILPHFIKNKLAYDYISKEIGLYQQLFVFSTLPMIFSGFKKLINL
ncbi:TPA: hypothetical protein KPJ80_002842 [Clostridioides difficile]|uniref:hypothetical protein n=1 Tax=Clostridioides difficile TaxID=1496 RepID=UPI000D1F1C37|nr:hypothetical protein [Clostridioides difficile]HBG2116743.1 hypothetical protein [Clostridioides difficile]HBG2166748.1 hypothetical protein [Clostridioides difficile]